jgi:transmembrane sensor
VTPSEEQVRAAVAQQAGTWFIANQSGSLEQAERAAFVAWLKASPIHVEEYLGVALIAHDLPAAMDEPDLPLESLLEMARADDTNGVVSLEPPMRVRDLPSKQVSRPRTWSFATSTAAAVLVLAASALWWLHDGDLLGLPKTYQTAHGEQIVTQLPDSSELHLNTIHPLRFDTPAASGWSRLLAVKHSSRLQETITGAFGSRLAMHK